MPAVVAAVVTFIMYIGELMLFDGVLYKFGSGFLFSPALGTPFAIVDMAVILLAGAITYGLTAWLNK